MPKIHHLNSRHKISARALTIRNNIFLRSGSKIPDLSMPFCLAHSRIFLRCHDKTISSLRICLKTALITFVLSLLYEMYILFYFFESLWNEQRVSLINGLLVCHTQTGKLQDKQGKSITEKSSVLFKVSFWFHIYPEGLLWRGLHGVWFVHGTLLDMTVLTTKAQMRLRPQTDGYTSDACI